MSPCACSAHSSHPTEPDSSVLPTGDAAVTDEGRDHGVKPGKPGNLLGLRAPEQDRSPRRGGCGCGGSCGCGSHKGA